MDRELMDVLWLMARWRWECSVSGPGQITTETDDMVDRLLAKHGMLFGGVPGRVCNDDAVFKRAGPPRVESDDDRRNIEANNLIDRVAANMHRHHDPEAPYTSPELPESWTRLKEPVDLHGKEIVP